jgi:hypothetical protein
MWQSVNDSRAGELTLELSVLLYVVFHQFFGDEPPKVQNSAPTPPQSNQVLMPQRPSVQSSSQPNYDCPPVYATLPEAPVQRQVIYVTYSQLFISRAAVLFSQVT